MLVVVKNVLNAIDDPGPGAGAAASQGLDSTELTVIHHAVSGAPGRVDNVGSVWALLERWRNEKCAREG